MKYHFLILLILPLYSYGQFNCNVYKMEGNQPCYEACQIATAAAAGQGLKSSQQQFDKAILQCPQMDYAFMEKSVPYLKRGDFITWKKLIDQAVALNPTGQLGYRGWCRYQFLRDYKGAIRDFEKLDSLVPYDIGYSQNGDYQLNIAKALCYKALGQKQKAIEIVEAQLAQKNYSPMVYDYLHLGILKKEVNDLDGAIACFNTSIANNDYRAEVYYYLGLIYKQKKADDLFLKNMEKARAYYVKGYRRTDPYTHPIDQVYLSDIERELNEKK